MLTLPTLKEYLAGAAMPETFDDVTLTAVLATENAAQRTALGGGVSEAALAAGAAKQAAHPVDLDMALSRRVARSLAARVLPLGYRVDQQTTVYTGTVGRDPEIARLEDPYRPVVFG